MYILLFECICCTIIYTLCMLRELSKQKEFTGFFIALGMYDLVFGIFPIIVTSEIIFEGEESRFIQNLLDGSSDGIYALVYYYLLALIGFIFLYLAYHGKVKRKTDYDSIQGQKKQHESIGVLMLLAWICLLIGGISLYLWSSAYGSIFNLILEANAVRSGNGSIVNGLAFLKHPTRLVLVCTFLFWALAFKSNFQNHRLFYKIGSIIGLVISMLASYLYLLANDGRLTIVLFLLAILWLAIAGKKFEHTSKIIVGGLLIIGLSFTLLSEMDTITHFIRFGEWNDAGNSTIISSLIHELLFLPLGGQVSVLASWNNQVQWTFFDDFITGAFAWFPYSLKPNGFEDVWNINTILIWGDISVSHGQWPCSFITQANYDLRIIGVILYSWVAGKVLKKIDHWELDGTSLFKIVIKANIMEFIFRGVPYFSFYDIMLGLFPIMIMVMIKFALNLIFTKNENGY